MRYCDKCGAEINYNQSFCTSCGSRVIDETDINTKSKIKLDKMVIVGIVSIAIIGAVFSTIGIIKKHQLKKM